MHKTVCQLCYGNSAEQHFSESHLLQLKRLWQRHLQQRLTGSLFRYQLANLSERFDFLCECCLTQKIKINNVFFKQTMCLTSVCAPVLMYITSNGMFRGGNWQKRECGVLKPHEKVGLGLKSKLSYGEINLYWADMTRIIRLVLEAQSLAFDILLWRC